MANYSMFYPVTYFIEILFSFNLCEIGEEGVGHVLTGFLSILTLPWSTVLGTAAAPVFAVVGAGGAVSYYVFC